MQNEQLSEREVRRYKNQMGLSGLGNKGQVKIKNSRVLVIGAGGKGTTTLKTLISAGVGFIGICDNSLVQEDIIAQQSLYGDNDIGKQKAIVSRQYLRDGNQYTKLNIHNLHLTPENLGSIINEYDIIIDATNHYQSHCTITKAIKQFDKKGIIGHIENNCGLVILQDGKDAKTFDEIFETEVLLKNITEDTVSPYILVNTQTGIALANECIKCIISTTSQLLKNMLIIRVSDYSFTLQPI